MNTKAPRDTKSPPSDAERLLTCLQSLDHESHSLLYEFEERDANINTHEPSRKLLNPGNLLLVADTQDEIVGYLARGGHLRATDMC